MHLHKYAGKLVLNLGVILCLVLLCGHLAKANPTETSVWEESITAQLQALGLGEIIGYIQRIDPDYREYIPGLELRDVLGRGQFWGSIGDLFRLFLQTLFREIVVSSHLLRQLVVIAILSAFLHQLQASFGEKHLVELAFTVCLLIVIFLGLQSFKTALSLAATTINDMVSFMYSLLPLMATLLASVGGITSAAIFHPLLMTVVATIAGLVHSLLFPLIYISAILGLLAHFSPSFPLSRLAGLAHQSCVILLSSFFVLFSSVMVVRGAIAPVADGITLRTAKFLTKTFVPVIGSMFADATEVIIGGSLLIKNAVGIFGLILIFFLAALPIIKIWAIILTYKVVGALIQPICDPRLVNVLGSLESSLTLILVAVATVTLMFFLGITILIGFGNLAVVMR